MTISKVIWCNRGWMPYHFGFCPDEAAWRREMKRLGVASTPYPDSDAQCSHFEQRKDRNHCTIVTITNERKPGADVAAMLVHEASHIWRKMRQVIGEQDPSSEFEAYSIQNISLGLFIAYEQTRGRLFR